MEEVITASYQDTVNAALYSNYSRTAMCDICGKEARGTNDDLRRNGWCLGGGSEICGECD